MGTKAWWISLIIWLLTACSPGGAMIIHNHGDNLQNTGNNPNVIYMSQRLPPRSDRQTLGEIFKDPKVAREWNTLLQKLDSLKGDLECDFCKASTFLIQQLLVLEKPEEVITEAVTSLCKTFHFQDARVCDGIMQVFKGEVLTVLNHIALSPTEVCGVIVGDSCASPYDPWAMWNISLPDVPKPPVVPPKLPAPGLPTLRVLQLSDAHVDLKYKEGSNVDCGEPLCCRPDDGQVKGTPAGKWGDYGACDIPTRTFDNLLEHLAKNDKFDYIIWTGDIPSHAVWNQTRDTQLNFVDYLTEKMEKYLPSTPVFYALGNHESLPVNSFPQPAIHGKEAISWLYNALAASWSHWLPNTTVPNIEKGGFYSVLVQPGLRLVSLNMNYCNNENWWLLLNMTDPADELTWFINILQQAEDNNEKVHVIGHIPPGEGSCLKAWSWNYYKIVNRYESTITGQFFGHRHTDGFQVFYDDVEFKRPISVDYVSPSVTTYTGLNPGYRVYAIDGVHTESNFFVLDHETYYMNLSDANKHDKPVWTKEYSAKEAYNMTSLFPADWDALSRAMQKDEAVFNKYYSYYYKLHSPGPCNDTCRTGLICETRTGRSHDPNLCKDIVQDYGAHLRWLHSMKLC